METTQNKNGSELNKRLNDAYKLISEETIMQMAKHDLSVNNVITGLNKECFGFWGDRDRFSPNYTIFYVTGESGLNGDALELCLNDKDNFELTFTFCNYLAKEYPHLDVIHIFNNYNRQVRSYVEYFGYLTVSDSLLNQFKGKEYQIITKDKGVFYIPLIDKLDFYRKFFEDIYLTPVPKGENLVYLLLDVPASYIKIGHSKKIEHREKTLQAQLPVIETIAFWKAPKEVETQLHRIFAAKRLRGEWFDLTFTEMKMIKDLMTKYQ